MAKNKRTNPRKRPATMADIKKAKTQALDEALNLAWSIFFMVLADKEGYTVEDMQRVWKHCEDLSDSIVQGYVTVRDLRETLHEENGMVIK